MGDSQRQCNKCQFAWYAKKVAKPQSPKGAGSFYALGGHHGSAAGKATKAVGKYQTKLAEYERWKLCPNCGSSSVRTVMFGRFEPTGSIVQRSAPPAMPTSTSAPPSGAIKCGCSQQLSPAWRFCPMCAMPTGRG